MFSPEEAEQLSRIIEKGVREGLLNARAERNKKNIINLLVGFSLAIIISFGLAWFLIKK